MIEAPEAYNLSKQINETIQNKKIKQVIAAQSPHKFAWYNGDPGDYHNLLVDHHIVKAKAVGGFIHITAENSFLIFSEGVNLRYIEDLSLLPKKHQLLLEFTDLTALYASVQMYGGLLCTNEPVLENQYYQSALEKPYVLSNHFTYSYFSHLINDQSFSKLSLKAFLATEQRIPGLGNGVLQDILYEANLHHKQKVETLTDQHKKILYENIKSVLNNMMELGGRDTEKDLFGNPGNYITKVSKNTVGQPCPKCKQPIEKGNYLGGSIYFCNNCQSIF
ncbi:MAG: endonuclease VIII [Spirochaetes bacterium]|nr:endonuclease VIII [Spirochaetota bacterium]